MLERLGAQAARLAFEPDAGIWEYRGRTRIHTHSSAMCWAGCNRLAAIAAHLGITDRSTYWGGIADAIQSRLVEEAWNEKRGAFTAGLGLDDLDASVLLLPEIGLVEANDPRFVRTVDAIEHELLRGKHIMRYASEDDFGLQVTAFHRVSVLADRCVVEDLAVASRLLKCSRTRLRYRNRYGLLR